MDAASRVELEALRRRAFGPDADIQDDPDALTRLIELEDLARGRMVQASAADAACVDRLTAADAGASRATGRRPRMRRRTLLAGLGVAAAIVAAVVVLRPGGEPPPAAAPTVTSGEEYVATDPAARRLMSIRLDAAFGGYIQLPSETPPPPFPSTTALSWATFLGDYYGWDLWVAGGSGGTGDEHCILLQREDVTRARCMDEEGQRRGALRVSLVSSDIPPEELRVPMDPDESIRFWWLDSGAVDLVLDSFEAG